MVGCVQPIGKTDSCYDNLDPDHPILHHAGHPVDKKVVMEKTDEEIMYEACYRLYQLSIINVDLCLRLDIRHWEEEERVQASQDREEQLSNEVEEKNESLSWKGS